MSVRPYRDIHRRKSRQIRVGSVLVGGDAPISVQTMTNTLTADAAATIKQIQEAEAAGCDIVRVSCPDEESTAALPEIVKAVPPAPDPEVGLIEKMIRCENSEVFPAGSVAVAEIRAPTSVTTGSVTSIEALPEPSVVTSEEPR